MWQYKTVDEKGHRESGVVDLDNYEEAVKYVRQNFGMILEMTKAERHNIYSNVNFTDRQRIYFFRQLAAILNSGITVMNGLDIIGAMADQQLVHVCKQLQVKIANGLSVSRAMAELTDFFPDLCVSLVRSGEQTGELVVISREIADYYEKKQQLITSLQRTLIYPLFVGAVALAVLMLFTFVVLPAVGDMYGTFRTEQSGFLAVMLHFRTFLVQYRWIVFALIALLVAAVCRYRHSFVHWLCLLPFFRGFYLEVLEIRFCKLLALLLNSGITIIEAITSAALVVDDDRQYMALQNFKYALAEGNDLQQAVEQNGSLFSPLVKSFILVGVKTGDLPKMLTDAVSIREEALQQKLGKINEFLGPLLLLVMAVFIGFVVISVLQPIFNLFETLPAYG